MNDPPKHHALNHHGGEERPVKVLDFGLVQPAVAAGTSENDATSTQRTATGDGTPTPNPQDREVPQIC